MPRRDDLRTSNPSSTIARLAGAVNPAPHSDGKLPRHVPPIVHNRSPLLQTDETKQRRADSCLVAPVWPEGEFQNLEGQPNRHSRPTTIRLRYDDVKGLVFFRFSN